MLFLIIFLFIIGKTSLAILMLVVWIGYEAVKSKIIQIRNDNEFARQQQRRYYDSNKDYEHDPEYESDYNQNGYGRYNQGSQNNSWQRNSGRRKSFKAFDDMWREFEEQQRRSYEESYRRNYNSNSNSGYRGNNSNSQSEFTKNLKILGLAASATYEEVKRAKRKLLNKWHPDKAPEGSAENYNKKSQEINAAYDMIVKYKGWE